MPGAHNFEHLPLLLTSRGAALLHGGGSSDPRTVQNRANRQAHSNQLSAAAQTLTNNWRARQAERQLQQLPVIPQGIPILLQVDPGLDIDQLRARFAFEIVAEQDEGYVIVASQDIDLVLLRQLTDDFSGAVRGSATVASVYRLFDDLSQTERLQRILSERLMEQWNAITDNQLFIVDVGVACTGTVEIPPFPNRGRRDDDAAWAAKELAWSQARTAAYDSWDETQMEREQEVIGFVQGYGGEILHMVHDGEAFTAGVLPDSFTVRLKINGKGLRDFALNYPYIFEILEPEDIVLPQAPAGAVAGAGQVVAPVPPEEDAPAVCVIDSGVQEGHYLLEPAIDQGVSRCFLPGKSADDVADDVAPGGHGTRVAGAVLFGEEIPKAGQPQLPFWIQNARVLDEQNRMPADLFPPEALRRAVEHFNDGPRQTRVFNHSINGHGYCRTKYMSAWAAEIDHLCNQRDILVLQSAGNLPMSGQSPFLGIQDHLIAGRDYPRYLNEPSARVANPGQSLQALTVGSVAHTAAIAGDLRTFAPAPDHPSAFSRTGPGIWNVIKPEVVEYGGDDVRSENVPPDVLSGGTIPAACPELVRSTMHPPGPAYDRDDAGTSYATPKVARLAAHLQRSFPEESALLYRALIVQSARWPTWAEQGLNRLRRPDAALTDAEKLQLQQTASETIRRLGFGKPDLSRASENTDYRTTLITSGESAIRAGECHIYQVPVPAALRQQADEFDIRIDVTLSYVAQPRRTRRNLRRYLSTWVDWKTSNLGEGLNDFRARAMKDLENEGPALPGAVLPWTLHEMPHWGLIRDVKRNSGTVQKDWAVVRSNTLPDHFCIAVVGHRGWSHDPDSRARYTLAVTFDILGCEMNIYEPLRTAVLELQASVEAEVEAEIEAEAEIEE